MNVTLTDSPYWFAAGWTMIHFLWIGAVIGAIVAVVRSALVRTNPAIRYTLALGLLLATALLPGYLFCEAVRLAGESRDSGSVSERVSESPVVSLLPGSAVSPSGYYRPDFDDPQLNGAGWLPTKLLEILFRWLPWLWISGTPTAITLLACGVIGAERLRRDSRPLEEGAMTVACRRLQASLGIRRIVSIAVSERIAAPLLIGIVRPVILLPAAVLAGCNPDQLEMIVLHELAHVRRWDNIVNLGQRLIEAVLFFHPVIWWLSNWVRLEREKCCDSVVLAHTNSPQVYAETLAALALHGVDLQPAAVAMTDAHLAIRIRHILNLEEETMTLSRKSCLIGLAVVVVGGCLVAGFGQLRNPGRATVSEERLVASKDDSRIDAKRPVESTRAATATKGPYKVSVYDVLSIDVASSATRNALAVGDEVLIRGTHLLPIDPNEGDALNKMKEISGTIPVQPDGTVDLGPHYGTVKIEGMTIAEAREAIIVHLSGEKVGLVDPRISVSYAVVAPKTVINGEYTLLPDGTVWLGKFGGLRLDGLTLEEVAVEVKRHMEKFVKDPDCRIGIVTAHL